MADVTWPYDLCLIQREDYGETVENNVRRTEMEDGAIAQSTIASRDFEIRRFTVFVKDENAAAFRRWLRAHKNAWFNYADLDGETREARLRGGNSRVQLRRVAGQRLDGSRYATAEIEIEGY